MVKRAGATVIAAALLAGACSSTATGDAVSDSTADAVTADAVTADAVDEATVADDLDDTTPATPLPESPGTAPETDSEGTAPGAEGDPDAERDAASRPDPYVPPPIEWRQYNDAVDVASVFVPVDYADPEGESFELVVARHRALDPDARIGSLLVNPGGPGAAGTGYALAAAQIFDTELLERFDIVAWDPRGTGWSEPAIDCIGDDYDTYFTAADSTPETEAERQATVALAQAFADACIANNESIIEHVGTNNSARDIDSIRAALGEDTVSYLGFSYGSELGATWATLFPDTVRAAVLDGAADPDADAFVSSLEQMAGFDAAVETFLARCAANADCAFHNDGDTKDAFLALLEQLDAAPIEVDDDRPPVNRDVALTATIQAMYSDSSWPALERALANAQVGDGAELMRLHDAYYRRQPDGTYPNFLEAFQVISCADTADRVTVEEADAQVPEYLEVAPLLVAEGSLGSYFCTFFPPALDPRADITGEGAGPIVVIATTGDPATPFESTIAMADKLEDGRLVIVDADQHLGYGVNRCVNEVVHRYLVDLDVPARETDCT